MSNELTYEQEDLVINDEKPCRHLEATKRWDNIENFWIFECADCKEQVDSNYYCFECGLLIDDEDFKVAFEDRGTWVVREHVTYGYKCSNCGYEYEY